MGQTRLLPGMHNQNIQLNKTFVNKQVRVQVKVHALVVHGVQGQVVGKDQEEVQNVRGRFQTEINQTKVA